jgi:osmotically inducible lipoprotein OsmB
MRKFIVAAGLATSVLALGACGNTAGDRALSGGAIGAGAGLVGGALLGAPVAGAAVGAVGGAAVGALTTPDQVNMGRPAWR